VPGVFFSPESVQKSKKRKEKTGGPELKIIRWKNGF